MALYEKIARQPSKLGNFESDGTLGQGGAGDQAAAIIDALGRATIGVTTAITTDKTARARARAGAKVAITQATEATKQTAIATRGATDQARIDVQRIGTTYSTLTKLIIGVGVALAGVIVAGGFAYSLAAPKKKR